MRIVFAGTPPFADAALRALIDAGYTVVGVLTQADRPAGRGMKLAQSPVKQTALEHHIPVLQPLSLRLDGKYPADAAAAQAALETLAPDVMVVAAYGLILPQWALDLPPAGCVNLHASLLPRWRGAAPIQRAIQAGDVESGVCLMDMEIGLDTGGVYARSVLPITPTMTGGALHDALADSAQSLICTHLAEIVSGQLQAVPQPEAGIVYAHKLSRSDGVLDWRMDAQALANQVRAFDPVPGCNFECAGLGYKVWAAQAIATESESAPGTVLALSKNGLLVACGSGALNITTLQRPGGKRMGIEQAWQGLVELQGQCLA